MIKSSKTISRLVIVTGAAMLVTACIKPSGDYQLLGGSYEDVYRSEYVYAVAENDVKTTIIGNPFEASKDATETAVIRAMNKVNKGHQSNFTTRPKTNKRNYHVVMVFDPQIRRAHLCNPNQVDAARPAGKQVSLGLVFCAGNRLVFAGSGVVDNLTGPDDPKFDALVQRLVWYFTPRYGLGDEEPD